MATVSVEERQVTSESRRAVWPVWARTAVSFLLIGHVAAVFAPPYRFASQGPRGSAPTAAALMETLRPYIDFAYLDHGYFFFAPNPGPSHLLQAEITNESGDRIVQRFPDRKTHWPRLLYHRHFMLAEWLNAGFAPPDAPPEIVGDQVELENWQRQRRMYELMKRSYREHLESSYASSNVKLDRVEHRPPELNEFRDLGWKLDDERLYRVLSENDFSPPYFPGMPPTEAVPIGPPAAGRAPFASPLMGPLPPRTGEFSPRNDASGEDVRREEATHGEATNDAGRNGETEEISAGGVQ